MVLVRLLYFNMIVNIFVNCICSHVYPKSGHVTERKSVSGPAPVAGVPTPPIPVYTRIPIPAGIGFPLYKWSA